MKRLVSLHIAIMLALAMMACSSPKNPQQAVFEARAAQNVALRAAVTYRELPNCKTGRTPCADSAVVAQLQKADRVADHALEAAETAVRTPGFGENVVTSAVAAATAALRAFQSIVLTLGVK